MPVLNELLKALPEHQNFYLRGVLNSLLPDFIDPSDGVVNENNISGEALETLKIVVANLHPDIKEGQVKSIEKSQMYRMRFIEQMNEAKSMEGMSSTSISEGRNRGSMVINRYL